MTTTTSGASLPSDHAPAGDLAEHQRIALLGNPNTGKTTLFNRLSGLRLKTANFPGTTVEARVGKARLREGDAPVELIDLPGVYSLELDQIEAEVCRRMLAGVTAPRGEETVAPSAVCVVTDASNLARNLMLVGETLRRRLPTVVALNMTDVAERLGLRVDAAALEKMLGCAVVPVCARSGANFDALRAALTRARVPRTTPGSSDEDLRAWAEELAALALRAEGATSRETVTDRLDRAFTHPVFGLVVFAALMTGLFWALFRLATWPMAWIEGAFGALAAGVESALPPGILADLLANGVIAGVAGTVVFLPQICLLFFLLSLLEDTGYLARAAFVVDRLLRPFGLPGHSFVPLLSSHACALPGIMGARVIPDRRERLATILVAPFMTCSARLPVYVLLLSLLFRDRPAMAALAFVGCYALGIFAGVAELQAAEPADRADDRIRPGHALPAQGRHDHPRDLDRALVDERVPGGRSAGGDARPPGGGGAGRGAGARGGRGAALAGVVARAHARPERVLRGARRPGDRAGRAAPGLRLADLHRGGDILRGS